MQPCCKPVTQDPSGHCRPKFETVQAWLCSRMHGLLAEVLLHPGPVESAMHWELLAACMMDQTHQAGCRGQLDVSAESGIP